MTLGALASLASPSVACEFIFYADVQKERRKWNKNKMRIYFSANFKLELCQHARELARLAKLNKWKEKDVTQCMPIRRETRRQQESNEEKKFITALLHINTGPTYFVNNFVCYPRALARSNLCLFVSLSLVCRIMSLGNDVSYNTTNCHHSPRANRAC